MKQKSAMQELIEWLMQQDELLMNKTRMIIVAKADSLLAKEREQIIEARMIPHSNIKDRKEAENYYSSKYGEQ